MHVVRFSDSDVAVIIPGGQVTPIPALRPRLRHAQLDPLRSRSAGGDVDDASCRAELLGVKQQLVALEAELTEADAVSLPSVSPMAAGLVNTDTAQPNTRWPTLCSHFTPAVARLNFPPQPPQPDPTNPTNQPTRPTDQPPTDQPTSQPAN